MRARPAGPTGLGGGDDPRGWARATLGGGPGGAGAREEQRRVRAPSAPQPAPRRAHRPLRL